MAAEIAERLRASLISTDTVTDRKTIYYFDSDAVSLGDINELRRFIYHQYDNTAIYALEVNKNTSSTPDTVYLGLFSFLLIDSRAWNGKTIEFKGQEYLGAFSIVATGTPNDAKPMLTAADFVGGDSANGLVIMSDPRAPIVWLRENEDIDIVAYVKRGKSGDHASFYPHTRIYTGSATAGASDGARHSLVVEKRYAGWPDIVETALELMISG